MVDSIEAADTRWFCYADRSTHIDCRKIFSLNETISFRAGRSCHKTSAALAEDFALDVLRYLQDDYMGVGTLTIALQRAAETIGEYSFRMQDRVLSRIAGAPRCL